MSSVLFPFFSPLSSVMGLKQYKKVTGKEWNKEEPMNQQNIVIPSLEVMQNGKCDFKCSREKKAGDEGIKG